MQRPTAVLVVSYGTSQPSALSALTQIRLAVGAAFPGLPLAEAFTSPFLHNTLARRDMLSGPESWHGQLSAGGLTVEGIPQGLGHCAAIRRLFVHHARQAAGQLIEIETRNTP